MVLIRSAAGLPFLQDLKLWDKQWVIPGCPDLYMTWR
jgi:hypothetical protein